MRIIALLGEVVQEFVIRPPAVILVAAAIVLLVALALLLRTRVRGVRRWIAPVIVALTAGMIVLLLYRPVTIRVGGDGLSLSGQADVSLSWAQIESAVYAPDLPNSPFRPTVRTAGIAIGEYRAGRFLLSNGSAARVFMAQSRSSVVVRGDGGLLLLAPVDVVGLKDAFNRHRVIVGPGGE